MQEAARGADIQEQAFEAAVAQTPAAEALLEAYEPAGSPVTQQHHLQAPQDMPGPAPASAQPLEASAIPAQADDLLPTTTSSTEATAASVAHSLSTGQLPPGAVAPAAEGAARQEQAFEAAATPTPAEEALLEAYEHPSSAAEGPHISASHAGPALDNGQLPQAQDSLADAHGRHPEAGVQPSSPAGLPSVPSAVRISEGQGPVPSSNGNMHPAISTDLGGNTGSGGVPDSPTARQPGSPSQRGAMSPAVMARCARCASLYAGDMLVIHRATQMPVASTSRESSLQTKLMRSAAA